MRRNLWSLFILAFALVFTACNDDDKIEFIGDELNGVYKGALDIELDSISVGQDLPQKIYITKTGDNLIKMELKNFSFVGSLIGDIVVENIAVIKTGSESSFIGAQDLTLVVGQCAVSVDGVINGDVIDIDIDIAVAGPPSQQVAVDFNGTKMAVDQSSEAKITSFTFAELDTIVIGEPIIEGNNIMFIVSEEATNAQIKALVPTITISDKATITSASGIAPDFNKKVVYTVTSEDEIYTTKYTVSIKSTLYSFEEWEGEGDGSNPDYSKPTGMWGTSNPGVMLIAAIFPDLYPGGAIVYETEGQTEKGVAIKTANTTGEAGGFFLPAIPKITSGSLFTGLFEVDMLNTLKSTKFGVPYHKQPKSVTGFFKYTPGEEYFLCSDPTIANIAVLDETKIDECALSAILYEVTSFDDKDEILTGVDIFTSDRIVAMAQKFNGEQKEFAEFSLDLEYTKEYDPSKKYRFAIIFSSSKDGDKFSGAINSLLVVDEVEIIN